MPKLSKNSEDVQDYGPVAVRELRADGYTINFVTFRENVDHTPLLKGLPDDRCPAPHWGYVLEGKVTFRYGDGEETYGAGDAFYAPAGHVPDHDPGTTYLQFSRTEELEPVSAKIMENMQQMQAAG
jgi:hypothetical protein